MLLCSILVFYDHFKPFSVFETIESQTQIDKLFEKLKNCSVERQQEAIAPFEVMAEMAEEPTPSVLGSEQDVDEDADMTPAGHVAKTLRYCVGGDGSPQGGAMVKQPVSFSPK